MIKILALRHRGKPELVEVNKPVPGPGEALIRVRMAGICNTDIEIVKGYMGFKGILGHEFVGVVEQCDNQDWIGKRVVGEINAACGKCDSCARDLGRHCPFRTVLGIFNRDGAFAEYLTLPVQNLFEVPENVSDERTVFVEPVAACFEIFEQVDIRPDNSIAVIGDGKLGLMCLAALKSHGLEPMLVGKHDYKMQLAREHLGVALLSRQNPITERFDFVVECSGAPSGLELATSLVVPRGVIILKSTCHQKPVIDTSLWVINEITVVGSRCGRFGPALEALSAGKLNPEFLISRVFDFNDAIEALDIAQAPDTLKVLLKIRRD